MNLQEYPKHIKDDIEDQSLYLLSSIREYLLVIGGWGVRAHAKENHGRYTLDVDAVADAYGIQEAKNILAQNGLDCRITDWGFQFYKSYKPSFPLNEEEQKLNLPELRIEISGPRITEYETAHYFEFSLTDYQKKKIQFHATGKSLLVCVPPVEDLAAVKLGLPADYKNILDSLVLLQLCSIEDVVAVIRRNDSWDETVLRRMPKYIGRINDRNSLVYRLAIDAQINVKKSKKELMDIEKLLKREVRAD